MFPLGHLLEGDVDLLAQLGLVLFTLGNYGDDGIALLPLGLHG